MDPLLDPFGTPDEATRPQGGNIVNRWGQALTDPGFRASLMQMGLQMAQPMGFGQNTMGHIAQAVGAGGEAAGRVEAQDLKELEVDRKIAQNEATLSQGQERLAIGRRNAATRERGQAAREGGSGLSAKDLFRAKNTQENQLRQQANLEAKAIAKQISDEAFLPKAERNPNLERYKGREVGDIAAEKMADPAWRTRWAKADAAASEPPPNQADLVKGKVYNTPKGPLMWNGKGFIKPSAASPYDALSTDASGDED